jgi:hypothetical protein
MRDLFTCIAYVHDLPAHNARMKLCANPRMIFTRALHAQYTRAYLTHELPARNADTWQRYSGLRGRGAAVAVNFKPTAV